MVERSSGCDMMHCSRCGQSFCFRCGTYWNTIEIMSLDLFWGLALELQFEGLRMILEHKLLIWLLMWLWWCNCQSNCGFNSRSGLTGAPVSSHRESWQGGLG
jgi:hypothetical protein